MTDEQADMVCEADTVIAAARQAAAASERLRGLLLAFADAHGERPTAERFGVHGAQLRRTRRSGRLALSVPTVQRIADTPTNETPGVRRYGRRSDAAHAAALADCEAALAAGTWSPAAHARRHGISRQAAHRHRLKVLASRQPA